MSLAGAKAQLAAALAGITWTIPTSAQGIMAPALKTSFGRIDTQQFVGEDAAVDAGHWPYCRIQVPNLDEQRKSDGGDAISQKEQVMPVHIFIYMAGYAKDWQGLGDYFDAVVDATLAYFRGNSSPQGGPISPGNNDHIIGWGLRQSVRVEPPQQFKAEAHYRATVAPIVRMRIV